MRRTRTRNRAFTLQLVFLVLVTMLAGSVFAQEFPEVVSVTPENADQEVSNHPIISVEFSKDMNSQTINNETFFMSQRTTSPVQQQQSRMIEGVVEYDQQNRTATFYPTDRQSPNQEFGNVYTIVLLTDIQDSDGNNLQQDYIWSFTTESNDYSEGSQQNMTAGVAPVQTTTSQPAAMNNTTDNSTAVTDTSSWWVSPGAFLLYLLGLILLGTLLYLLLSPTKQTRGYVSHTNKRDPFGDVYEIRDVEGIGDEYASKLKKANVENTKQLWMTSAHTLANKTGISIRMIRHWQAMAELMAIKGIGGQYAELLERSGVRSIDELANSDPKALLRRVERKQRSVDSTIQGTVPGEAIVSSWVSAANDHQSQERAKT